MERWDKPFDPVVVDMFCLGSQDRVRVDNRRETVHGKKVDCEYEGGKRKDVL